MADCRRSRARPPGRPHVGGPGPERLVPDVRPEGAGALPRDVLRLRPVPVPRRPDALPARVPGHRPDVRRRLLPLGDDHPVPHALVRERLDRDSGGPGAGPGRLPARDPQRRPRAPGAPGRQRPVGPLGRPSRRRHDRDPRGRTGPDGRGRDRRGGAHRRVDDDGRVGGRHPRERGRPDERPRGDPRGPGDGAGPGHGGERRLVPRPVDPPRGRSRSGAEPERARPARPPVGAHDLAVRDRRDVRLSRQLHGHHRHQPRDDRRAVRLPDAHDDRGAAARDRDLGDQPHRQGEHHREIRESGRGRRGPRRADPRQDRHDHGRESSRREVHSGTGRSGRGPPRGRPALVQPRRHARGAVDRPARGPPQRDHAPAREGQVQGPSLHGGAEDERDRPAGRFRGVQGVDPGDGGVRGDPPARAAVRRPRRRPRRG